MQAKLSFNKLLNKAIHIQTEVSLRNFYIYNGDIFFFKFTKIRFLVFFNDMITEIAIV